MINFKHFRLNGVRPWWSQISNYKHIKSRERISGRKGFTLVELLVSMSIFVLFLGIVANSYIGIVRSQRQANGVRKMYSEVRTFMDTLAQDFRLGSPDYDCYEPGQDVGMCPIADVMISPEAPHYLVIASKDQDLKTIYRFNSQSATVQVKKFVRSGEGWAEAPDFVSFSGDDGYRSLFDTDVKIKNLEFKLFPPKNPYSELHYADNQYQFQPQVTVFLAAENAVKEAAPFTMNLQTTFSSRTYSRAD